MSVGCQQFSLFVKLCEAYRFILLITIFCYHFQYEHKVLTSFQDFTDPFYALGIRSLIPIYFCILFAIIALFYML
jgi:hypothetical protein